MIKTLAELYLAFDELLEGISDVCQSCHDDDCLGYLWLLPEESTTLLDADVEILEVNDALDFINPFAGGKTIDVEQLKPPCPWCQSHCCTIRQQRPLVCRMYPLNFATENDTIYLVLHMDCEYARQVYQDADFLQRAVSLFQQISPDLFAQVIEVYSLVDSISKFPSGPNRYLRIVEVDKLRA